MASILAIDDEQAIVEMIERILSRDGHQVTGVCTPADFDLSLAAAYDLILLDIMMPDLDGFALCARLRERVDCPIVFLTARSEESSVVSALALGADDYLCKPFGVAELRARVGAHLRRERRGRVARLAFAGSSFDLSAKQLCVGGEIIPLTKGEYAICEFLARNQRQVFSKEQILEAVFGFDSESSESTIATHIKNIRLKLQKHQYAPIHTVWGVGYKWED